MESHWITPSSSQGKYKNISWHKTQKRWINNSSNSWNLPSKELPFPSRQWDNRQAARDVNCLTAVVTNKHICHAKPEKQGDDEETLCVMKASDTYGCNDKRENKTKPNWTINSSWLHGENNYYLHWFYNQSRISLISVKNVDCKVRPQNSRIFCERGRLAVFTLEKFKLSRQL